MALIITGGTIVGSNPDISAGRPDLTFNIGTGFGATTAVANIEVLGFVIDTNNKIYCATQGANQYNNSGFTTGRIIKLNEDGTWDSTYNINALNAFAIQIQTDNKIILGGFFSTISGVTSNGMVRLNTDGSPDTSFSVGTGFSLSATSAVPTIMRIQNDGKFLVAGGFTFFSGLTVGRFIRLNTNGSLDNQFGTGFNNTVNAVEIQSDGKILVAGNFTSYSGISRNRIVRLNSDGSVDNSFAVVSFTGGSQVSCIGIQPDGKILLGHNATAYSGVSGVISTFVILRLNSDGTFDSSFSSPFTDLLAPRAIRVQSDGKIICVGNFTSVSGFVVNRVVRLNTDGSIDTSFVVSNGLIGSGFDSVGSTARGNIVYIYPNFDVLVATNSARYRGVPYGRLVKIKGTDLIL